MTNSVTQTTDYGILLDRHLRQGTRPKPPNRRWTNVEFAAALGVTDRAVRNWRQSCNRPSDKQRCGIELHLFGNTGHDNERKAMDEAYEAFYSSPESFSESDKPCNWCGGFHQIKCPLVKAYEYDQNGRVRRVEFFAPIDYGVHGAAIALQRKSVQ